MSVVRSLTSGNSTKEKGKKYKKTKGGPKEKVSRR